MIGVNYSMRRCEQTFLETIYARSCFGCHHSQQVVDLSKDQNCISYPSINVFTYTLRIDLHICAHAYTYCLFITIANRLNHMKNILAHTSCYG